MSKAYAKHVALFLLVFMLVQVLIIGSILLYYKQLTMRQLLAASNNVIESMHNHVNRSVEQAESDLQSLLSRYINIRILSSDNENARQIVASNLNETLRSLSNAASNTDAYIIYNNIHDICLISRSNRLSYQKLVSFRGFVEKLDGSTLMDMTDWSVVSFEGSHYLLRCYYYYGSFFVALFACDSLLSTSSFSGLFDDMQSIVLSSDDGTILSSAGSCGLSDSIQNLSEVPNSFFINTTVFPYSGLKISFICEKNLSPFVDTTMAFILSVCLSSLLLLVAFLCYIQNELLKPLNELMRATWVVEQGDYTYRAQLTCHNLELQELATSINSMIDMIIRQRIASYENMINRMNMELKYLQMQIRPHSFLNVLSTIHSMSYMNDNARIRRFVDLYSQNIRYLFAASLQTVPLKNEIQHIREYIDCQNILYPDCVFSFIEVEPAANDWLIPQMLLHVLVENVYKHIVSLDRFTSLFIRASVEQEEDASFLQLIIEDDGIGFPQDVIDQINNADGTAPIGSSRIGLMNLTHTLFILYGNCSLVQLKNKSNGGGIVQVRIPRTTVEMKCEPHLNFEEETRRYASIDC
ncbi:MAG: histidine kinase [Clostridia bacterium]